MRADCSVAFDLHMSQLEHAQKGQWTFANAALQNLAHARVVLPPSMGLHALDIHGIADPAPLLLVAVFRAALELASAFACGLFGIVGAWTGPPLLCVAQNGHLAQAQKAQCVAANADLQKPPHVRFVEPLSCGLHGGWSAPNKDGRRASAQRKSRERPAGIVGQSLYGSALYRRAFL